MADVNVATPDGQIGSLPAEDAQRAIDAGQARPATPGEVAGAKAEQAKSAERARYSGPIAGQIAQSVGAIRGAAGAVGIPFDRAAIDAAWLASPELAESVRGHLGGLKDANPTQSAIGEFAGSLLPAAMGDEVGPINAIGSMAEKFSGGAVARALGGAAGSTIGKVVTRGAALAARGGVEGAMMGAVDQINESAIKDHELTAEALLAGAKNGALGGALFGGAMGAGVELAGAARRGVASAMQGLSFGVAPGESGVAGRLHEAYVKAASAATGADPETIRALTSLSREGAEARRIATTGADDLINDAARAVRTHGDALLQADRLVADEARGSLKADYVRRAVKVGNEAETAARAQEQLAALVNAAEERLTSPNGVGFAKSVESVSKSSYGAAEEIARAVKSGEDVNAKIFVALDNVKRDVQRLARNGNRGVANVADPLERRLAQDSADWFRSAAEELRVGLEDERLWGKAASDQRSINAAWSRQIDASGRFHGALTTEVGRDPLNPYLTVRGIDPGKAESYVRGITNANKDLTHQAVQDYLQSTQELAKAISQSYELPPEKLAEVARIHASADKLRETLQSSTKGLQIVNSYRALREAEKGSGLSAISGALGGGAFGGFGGSIVGGVAGAVARPGQVVGQMAAMEQMMRGRAGALLGIEKRAADVQARISDAVAGFFTAAAPAARAVERSPDKLFRLMGGEESDDKASKRDRFAALTQRIAAAASSPDVQAAHVQASVGEVHEHAPAIGTQAAANVQRAIAFLATKIPPGTIDPRSLQPQFAKPEWSDAQMSTFLRYVEAADSPLTVLDDLESHRLTKEQVETIKTLYPRLFQEVQRTAMGHLTSAKKPLPYQARIQIGTMLGVPSDQSLDPAFIADVQGTFADQAPAPGGPPSGAHGSPSVVESSRSESERVEGM